MKTPVLILIFLLTTLTTLTARTIKPKTVKAKDRSGHYRGGHRGHNNNIMISSMEASSQISFQLSSIVTLEGSTDATSGYPNQKRGRREYSQIEFLNNNRSDIDEDISTGGGEYLITLMSMMDIKKDDTTLVKVQLNFENLLALEDNAFLSKLREVSQS